MTEFVKPPLRVLMLNDPLPFRESMPNTGDRALYRGFEKLLEGQGVELASGRWKVFPYLTGKAYEDSSLPPDVWLQRRWERCRRISPWLSAIEAWVGRWVLGPLARSGLLTPFDRVVQRHTGMGLIASLETRLLPHYHARELMRGIEHADAVVFCGGGLIAEHLGNFLPERLFELYLAKRMGKPVAAANYSVSLLDRRKRALAAEVLKMLDLHLVREPKSAAVLQELGVDPQRIITSLDSAFAYPNLPPRIGRDSASGIGVMIRGDREVNVPAWGHLLKRLRAEYACEIHYLQSCGKYDPEVRRELARQHVQLDDDGKFLGLKRVLQEVARRKLLITDRYHGVIYAILTGVPVVAAESSTHKTRGLLEAIGYPIPVLPPLSEGSVDDYIETVARALADEDALRRQLLRVAGTAKSQLMQDYRVLVERLAAAVN